MGYPYDKRYIDKIRADKRECERIEDAYHILKVKYMRSKHISDDIELSIAEQFAILGEAFELGSITLEAISDEYHFMWDVIEELLTPTAKEEDKA